MFRPTLLCILLTTAAACATEPTATAVAHQGELLAAKGGGSSGSVRTISTSGDIAPLTRADGTPVTASVNASRPFKNLVLEHVTITLGAPTGDPSACMRTGSTRTYSASFGANAGTWTGDLTVWQGSTPAASNFRFSGSRTNPETGASEWIQFTSNDNDAVQTVEGSTVTLQFNSAPLGFGSNSTYWDLDASGLPVLRCVRLTIVAAP